MNSMFSECSSLQEIHLNNFDTNNVTSMSDMFIGCSDELKLKIKSKYKNLKEEAFKNSYWIYSKINTSLKLKIINLGI